jgi:hypothetical protein
VDGASSNVPSRSNSRFSTKSKSILKPNLLNSANDGIPEDKAVLSSDHHTESSDAQATSPPKPSRVFASPTEEMVFTDEPREKDSPGSTIAAFDWMQRYLQREEEEERIWQKKLNAPNQWTTIRDFLPFLGNPKSGS